MVKSMTATLDSKTTGAWLVHHTQKLQQVNGSHQFNNLFIAGKASVLLSALSATHQSSLDTARVNTLAQAASINTYFELPKLLELLEKRKLIQRSATGIDVLGVTGSTVLQHGAEILGALNPTGFELASISLAEMASSAPVERKISSEFLSDTCKLTKEQSSDLLDQSEHIGFIDHEELGDGNKVYFNGNLFRRGEAAKVQAVLSSLTAEEYAKVVEIEDQLRRFGCLAHEEIEQVLGKTLFSKLNSISMYDVNVVSNDRENIAFITRPAAFSKYGNSMIEDSLDLAKAFVSSLTYGMTRSASARGKITMIEKLLSKLIQGGWVGPVDAIGQDYRALELKHVVEVKRGRSYGYEMRLLKKDVGEMALKVIKAGDASEIPLLKLPGASVTGYVGPEVNREIQRKRQTPESKKAVRDMVMVLRTGGSLS